MHLTARHLTARHLTAGVLGAALCVVAACGSTHVGAAPESIAPMPASVGTHAPRRPPLPFTPGTPIRGGTQCRTSAVWSTLDACGWPGPMTTGYPAGQSFVRTVTGGLVITADNTVVDGWRRSGNTVLESGEAIDAGNPHTGGRLCT